MLAKLSVEQSLMKAKSYSKKGDLAEAQKLYETILKNFSNNIRAQQGLASLNKYKQNNVIQNPPQVSVDQLVNLYNQGQMEAVIEQAEALTAQYPGAYVVWNILGVSRDERGMLDESINAFNNCISLKPNYADAHFNMAIALKNQGKLDEAIEAYKKSISLKPNDADTYYNMGVALKDQGKLDEAIEAYKTSISLKPNYAEVYNNLGVVFQSQGKCDEAIQVYDKSILLKSDYAEAYNNKGALLQELGKFDEAMEALNKSILLKPDYADAYNNIGLTLQSKNKLSGAIEAYKKSISLKPDFAEAYYNKGVALKDQGKLDEAIDTYKKSISLKSNYVEAYINMGAVLKDQGKLDEAIEAYKESISLKPDFAEAHYNLGFTLLNSGRLKEGLDAIEWRWKIPQLYNERSFIQPMWDGSQSLKDKRILLWCEQGIGDTLKWSSCLSLLASQAKHCILECQDKLIPLLQRSFPNVEIKSEDRSLDMNRDDFDYHLPMGSLYRHFLSEITQNTNPKAYLVPDPGRVNYWRERLNSLGRGPYVGIAWKSSKMSPNRLPNYAPISEWSPVLKIPDVTFINLQYKDFEDDLAKVKDEFGVTVHNFDELDQFNNVDDTTALCAALDMLVSNHGTAPLISGGVGIPTKLANWKQSGWNTILHDPVGPSIDIFERNTWETWDNVFRLIEKDIFKQINN